MASINCWKIEVSLSARVSACLCVDAPRPPVHRGRASQHSSNTSIKQEQKQLSEPRAQTAVSAIDALFSFVENFGFIFATKSCNSNQPSVRCLRQELPSRSNWIPQLSWTNPLDFSASQAQLPIEPWNGAQSCTKCSHTLTSEPQSTRAAATQGNPILWTPAADAGNATTVAAVAAVAAVHAASAASAVCVVCAVLAFFSAAVALAFATVAAVAADADAADAADVDDDVFDDDDDVG